MRVSIPFFPLVDGRSPRFSFGTIGELMLLVDYLFAFCLANAAYVQLQHHLR